MSIDGDHNGNSEDNIDGDGDHNGNNEDNDG